MGNELTVDPTFIIIGVVLILLAVYKHYSHCSDNGVLKLRSVVGLILFFLPKLIIKAMASD